MASKQPAIEYRPPRWLVALAVSSFALFAALAGFFIQSSEGIHYTLASLVLTLLAALGVVEVLVSRIMLESDSVLVRSLFRSQRILFRDVEEVRLDGGRTCLRLKSGGWKKLPEWLGASMSVRHRIGNRLAQLDGSE